MKKVFLNFRHPSDSLVGATSSVGIGFLQKSVLCMLAFFAVFLNSIAQQQTKDVLGTNVVRSLDNHIADVLTPRPETSNYQQITDTVDGGKDGNIIITYELNWLTYTAVLWSVKAPPSAKSFTVPKRVEYRYHISPEELSEPYYFSLVAIGHLAFAETSFEEVVIKHSELREIGARAFLTSKNMEDSISTIKRIIFTTDNPPTQFYHEEAKKELGGFQKHFAPHQKIHVKKSKVDVFKNAANWGEFRNQISYTIEGRAVPHKYATFCCDFNADFSFENTSDLPGNVSVNDNFAFFIGHPMQLKYGNGDYGNRPTPYKLHLNRLRDNILSGGAGALIQNTGNSTTEKFYYRVSENQPSYGGYPIVDLPGSVLGTNRFNQAYVNVYRHLSGTEIYVLQEGVFRKIPKSLQKFGMNYQTCFLLTDLPTATNAPEEIGFMEEDTTTGVSTLTIREGEEAAYDLRGLRTSPSPRGSLIIKNGKKVFTK